MTSSKLSFYYQNCGGIRTKLPELRLNILNSDYDIIILTETWLQPKIHDAEIVDNRYLMIRKDRDLTLTHKKDGGGLLIAYKKNLAVTHRLDWEDQSLEEIYICLPLKNNQLILHTVYIPPASPKHIYEKHLRKLEYVYTTNPDSIFCVIGDFNLPELTWTITPPTVSPLNIPNEVSKILINTITTMALNQYNGLLNINNRTLDLLFCSQDCQLSQPNIALINPDRHHPHFEFLVNLHAKQNLQNKELKKYNFFKADYNAIRAKLLTINWHDELNTETINTSVDRFYDILYNILDDYVPLNSNKNPKYPVWFTPILRSTLKRKQKMWHKWIIYGSLRDYAEYSLLRARCKSLLIKCLRDYTAHTEVSLSKNIKHFWRYVHDLKNNNDGLPRIMFFDSRTSDNPTQIANMFAEFFSSVFESTQNLDNVDLSSLPISNSMPLISNLKFDKCTIEKCVKQLDITKGPGPDKISPIFLKNISSIIASPLHILFNRCMRDGVFPDKWKMAYVTPIHKSGSKGEITHYRPISILSCIPKLLERLVHDAIFPLLKTHISNQQHGFMKNKSTVTNLIHYSDYLFNALDKREQVDTIYTDFRKAFDKVDHVTLLKKLAFHGIHGNLLNWFASYLSNRQQAIVINGYTSDIAPVTSGVVQGSILGPLQYILFINDMAACFQNCRFLMFADDLKVFRKVSNINDCRLIQEDLDRFSDYCSHNKLYLAHDKCVQISFTKNTNKIKYTYEINGIQIKRVTSIRDLGIQFDEKLKFDEHIDNIVTKASQMLGFILRISKHFKNPATYITLYQSLVRPHLEYASTIWNPLYAIYREKVEMVQKKFLRALYHRLTGANTFRMSYTPLLRKFKFTTLANRRLLLDAVTLHDICTSHYDCPQLLSQVNFRAPSRITRSQALFDILPCQGNAGVRAPLRRICDTYNRQFLTVDIFSNSRLQFKHKIKLLLEQTAEQDGST